MRLRLPWGTTLYRAPSNKSTAFTLGTPGQSWREPIVLVRAAVGKNSEWLKVETPEHCFIREADEFRCERRIPALDFYELTLYVPAGVGHWYEAPAREQPAVLAAAIPYPEQGDQVNANRRGTHQWLVEDGEAVYWSNGKRAGTVSAPHLFNIEGERRDIAKRKLTCFEVLIGLSPDATRLCFARSKVKKIAAQNSPSPLNSIDEDIDLSLDPKAYGLEK